jgi:hypothetical protein
VIESWFGEDGIPCTYMRYLAELAVNFEIVKIFRPQEDVKILPESLQSWNSFAVA